MNSRVGRARIGQWYRRSDKGEIFQVVGYDDESRSIEVQTFDGDLDEIDAQTWAGLPLELVECPEDWTGPVDDLEPDDLGYSETDMSASDWAEPLQTLRADDRGEEAWEDSTPEDERDSDSVGAPVESFALERPKPARRLR